MNQKPISSNKILSLLLHIAALAVLLIDNGNALWLCILLFGAFTLVSLLQDTVGHAEKGTARFYWPFLLAKCSLCIGCLFLFRGLGTTLLFCILVLDICSACPPLLAGLLSAALLGTLVVFSPWNQDVMLLRLMLFLAITLLARTARSEQALGQSMAETISALRVSEKQLIDMNRQMQQFQDRLADASKLQERSRITKSIHDTLGHTLTAIVVQLSAALQIIGRDNALATDNIRNARDQAKQGLDSVRETIHMLDFTGTSFPEKLKHAIEGSEKSMGIRVLPVIDLGAELSVDIQQILLSCLKEGLTNGVRHGSATAFVLKLDRPEGSIRFYLEDNGTGCAALAKGYGLTAMEAMVEQAGGTLEAATILNEGFTIKITLPSGTGNGEEPKCCV